MSNNIINDRLFEKWASELEKNVRCEIGEEDILLQDYFNAILRIALYKTYCKVAKVRP
jgi:hypothetical protein